MSIRAALQKVLHVAPPIGLQHATNLPDIATSNATLSATTCGKASSDADIHATSSATVAQQPVESNATLSEQQREGRQQKAIVMLKAAPDTKRAIYADTDSDPHNVILAIAVRHPTGATCEMLIDKAKYDPWRLLELIERLGVQNVH